MNRAIKEICQLLVWLKNLPICEDIVVVQGMSRLVILQATRASRLHFDLGPMSVKRAMKRITMAADKLIVRSKA